MYDINNEKIRELLDYLYLKRIKVVVWGLGLKGKAFLEEFDPSAKYIAYVIDRDKSKQEEVLATGHVVKSEEKIDKESIILIPDDISPSICMYMLAKGYPVQELKLIPLNCYINDVITLNDIKFGLPWKGKRYYD